MEAMIRKQRKRELESNKQSAFRLRKQQVTAEKIERYIKEHPTQSFDTTEDTKMDGIMDSASISPSA
jgi:hypothetical protein